GPGAEGTGRGRGLDPARQHDSGDTRAGSRAHGRKGKPRGFRRCHSRQRSRYRRDGRRLDLDRGPHSLGTQPRLLDGGLMTTATIDTMQDEVRALARERDAVILAHNYQVPEVQDVADFVGDSLGLSREAAATDAE